MTDSDLSKDRDIFFVLMKRIILQNQCLLGEIEKVVRVCLMGNLRAMEVFILNSPGALPLTSEF